MTTWKVLCDFDGTIALNDVTDGILEKFGLPGWREIEAEWVAGKIGSRECMSRQIALVHASCEELDAYLSSIEIDSAFCQFVAALRAADMELEIVSDGVDRAVRAVLARHGLGALKVIANHLLPAGPSRWRLVSPHSDGACASGTCKCARARSCANGNQRLLVIGDGRSDFCVAELADVVFAKAGLIDHCRNAGIGYVPIRGFADALSILPSLSERVLGDRTLEDEREPHARRSTDARRSTARR